MPGAIHSGRQSTAFVRYLFLRSEVAAVACLLLRPLLLCLFAAADARLGFEELQRRISLHHAGHLAGIVAGHDPRSILLERLAAAVHLHQWVWHRRILRHGCGACPIETVCKTGGRAMYDKERSRL